MCSRLGSGSGILKGVTMTSNNVLRVNAVEERTAYEDAVHEILCRVISENGATLVQIAEKIDVSLGTISNAFNKKAALNPLYLNRLGIAYGPHILDPFAKLCGARFVPLEVQVERDVLPFLQRASLRIAEARDPASPGGTREILKEKLDYLADLRAVVKEAGALICQIEAERRRV